LIRCISLHQPWASMIAAGLKKVETRCWKFSGPFPSLLGIHASRYDLKHLYSLVNGSSNFFRAAAARLGNLGALPSGALVCVVRAAECVGTAILADTASAACQAARRLETNTLERYLGNYLPGRYAWSFDRLHVLGSPVLMKGRQRFWFWDCPLLEGSLRDEWGVPVDGTSALPVG
jgi:activating signal cointegrator 1